MVLLLWKTGHRQCGFVLSEPSGTGDDTVCIWLLVSGSSGGRVSSAERIRWHRVANHGRMPAGDCCWQCFLQHLTWALCNTSASCTSFISYLCELFIDFPPPPFFFFFFLLTATDVFVINYLVDIVWHKREYCTNDYIFLLCVAFFPALLWSPHSWSHGWWQ